MVDPADSVTVPLPVALPTRINFASPDRIYSVALERDLLGDWCVIQSWGGKNNNRGGGKIHQVASYEEGLALMRSIVRRRERHGYQIVK